MTAREGLRAWRRLGPVRGTAAAGRLAAGVVRTPVRRARLRVRPLRVSARAVARELGTDPASALRGPALAALPTVAAWEREVAALDAGARDDLLARAERIRRHEFDLLGSGPVALGERIDWQRDFKSGVSWPLVHISRVPTVLAPGADIKVPWELSRFQHLPLLAAAYRVTGERAWLDEIGAQLRGWIAANPVEIGANWTTTMDVAIRAANWVAALAMVAADAPWLDDVLASLLLHGRFIRTHLEWGEVRGNHYLSDVVGLLPVAALFSGGASGRAWADWAVGELEAEMAHQVRPDGVDHEMSTLYHRLVCELFVCGAQAAEALAPGRLSGGFHERLDRMLAFARDVTRPDGLAPQVGDADDGRFLPLGGYGADPRDVRHLFAQAGRAYVPAAEPASYPDGGFEILRAGPLYALVRCGDTGLHGLGGHAHNDQLSFELCAGDQPLVVDPGAYVYTPDPAARNAFRSTAAHATLRLDAAEQNPLRSDYLFALADRTRAEAVERGRNAFTGRHHGYAPAVHERRFALDAEGLTVADTVRSDRAHELEWSFPLDPSATEVQGGEGGASAAFPHGRLEIDAPGLVFVVEGGWHSPRYGVRVPSRVLRARRRSAAGEDVTQLRLRATTSAR